MPVHALWPLPAVIDPPDRRCYIVQVPNDRYHIAAFLGALYELTVWKNWERDAERRAKPTADVWWGIWQNLISSDCSLVGGDNVQFRQNGCKLEYSLDCVTWLTLYDPTECIQEIAGQPGGGGPTPAGECREYDAVLPGNGRWLLPVPVSTGYTIEVSGAAGAWYDGASLVWRCPNGQPFILGSCSGATVTDPADPISTAPHMSLISKLETVGPQYFEVLTGVYTVPADVSEQNLSFQANDSNLTDNAGSISFHVKVCAPGTATWCYEFDFLTSDGDWTAFPTLNPAAWTLGLGWHDTYPGSGPGDDGIYIVSPAFSQRILQQVTVLFDIPWAGDNPRISVTSADGSTVYNFTTVSGSTAILITIPDILTGQIMIIADPKVGDKQHFEGNIIGVRLEGLGNNPFGADNCP